MLAIAFGIGLSACATPRAGTEDHAARLAPTAKAIAGAELYRGRYSFVRLEPAGAGAAPNRPHAIDTAELSAALAQLTFNGAQAVFLPEELSEIAPHLARALARATAGDDVVFAVTAKRKLLGLLAPHSVTTGRLFVADGKLNLIVGLLHSDFDVERISNQPTRVFIPGSRLRPVVQAGKVAGGAWSPSVPDRSDWLSLPLERLVVPALAPLPAASAAIAMPATVAATAPAISDVERRLTINERLKQQGLVSEQEYQEKRRAILKDF